YVRLTDRAKDLVKSGGEWISSIDLENTVCDCPGVKEAAVVGAAHPKWDERPILLVVRGPNSTIEKKDILEYLSTRVARWWLPDEVIFLDSLPHTATGKLDKKVLRVQYVNYLIENGVA